MTRGGTVYFTAKAVLNTGEESALSPAYAWVVPVVTPPPATLTSIAVSGPSSVNEGGTGTYTATGTWDNGTTAAIAPTWSENSTYATISAGGVLTASAVTANQAVTVTATYGGRTGTMSVTIVDVPAVLTAVDGERPVVGERGRHRDVHGDGYVGQRDDGGDQPDVERELDLRDDQRGRRADGVRGDGEPGGDGDGELRRPHRHDERDDRRRAGGSDRRRR